MSKLDEYKANLESALSALVTTGYLNGYSIRGESVELIYPKTMNGSGATMTKEMAAGFVEGVLLGHAVARGKVLS